MFIIIYFLRKRTNKTRVLILTVKINKNMYIIYENIDVICTKYSKSPAANPVTRFPSRSSTTATAAATPTTKAS